MFQKLNMPEVQPDSNNSPPTMASLPVPEPMSVVDVDFDFADEFEAAYTVEEFQSTISALKTRCDIAGIKYTESPGEIDDVPGLLIEMKSGRKTRSLLCASFFVAKSLASVSFEKLVLLEGLEAVVDYEAGIIEAMVRPIRSVFGPRTIIARIKNLKVADVIPGVEFEIESNSPHVGKILLSLPSDTALAVLQSERCFAFKISCPGLKQHDAALEYVQRVASAFFFQIDQALDLPLSLVRWRPPRALSLRGPRFNSGLNFSFPNYQLDAAPASLYWYGVGASSMPLLQFLALYQVVEYYYPTYSQAEARRKLQLILKDPNFRIDRDADLGRVLSATQVNRVGGFGDERSQLKATLHECVNEEDLKVFIDKNAERASFWKQKKPGLSSQKISTETAGDLRAEVAERIYEIRCRIVHTKADGKFADVDILLPFSPEVELMQPDIELMRFIARCVLIAGSSQFIPYSRG